MALKVKYAFLTTESAEPYALQSFIDGYESAGGVWDGTIDVEENVTIDEIDANYMNDLIDDDYEMLIRNTGTYSNSLSIHGDALANGLISVIPSGSNNFDERQTAPNTFKFTVPFCGSGPRDIGNATSYPCVFYDQSSQEEFQDITMLKQCGTEYTISQIKRVNATTLYIKLSGVTDVRTVGITEQGVPLYISTALTGTDISPLPTGTIYTSNVIDTNDPSYFSITFNTSAGSTSGYQSVTTGAVKYGSAYSDEVLIIRDGYNVDTQGSGISIKDVTGFENNPNGRFEVSEYVNNDGYGNKIKIRHSLGTGSYVSGGSMIFATQSYATPYIAGQLAFIKDSLNCDWNEAWGRAIATASNYPDFDTYNGYGYINVADAIALEDISLSQTAISVDVFTYDYGDDTKYQTITWSIDPFAEYYEIWYRGELWVTLKSHILKYQLIQERGGKGTKNYIKIRSKRADSYGEFSELLELPFYKYDKGILINEYQES